MATIGVEQHTFGATVLGCVCRCGTIGKPNDPIIGNTHVNKFPKHIIIGGFGWRRLVASNRSNGNFTNGDGFTGGCGWWWATPIGSYLYSVWCVRGKSGASQGQVKGGSKWLGRVRGGSEAGHH